VSAGYKRGGVIETEESRREFVETRRVAREQMRLALGIPRGEEAASNSGDPASNRKQRWDRKKYNEYQKELMRRRRRGS